ncbi:MAG TPA: thioesterase family protein [Sphingobium sp.]|uniref:thioesterase family protein n=1 Tax=Sphingobium sp. TaxID=1912891 RepID=UPI002ED56333
MTEEHAYFTVDDRLYVPTGLGVSPWNGRSIGGVPLAGLTAHLIGTIPPQVPMHVARLTIDIFGTVPMEPLAAKVEVLRDGRRVQLLSVELTSGGRTWVRATALRVRTEETPAIEAPLTRDFPGEALAVRPGPLVDAILLNDPRRAGQDAWWLRFLHPVVLGTRRSPLESVAMLSDFGAGISALYPTKEWTLANLDISVHLSRMPRSDWLLVDAESGTAGNGIGTALSRLGDRDGMIGTAHQTVFLDRR